MHPIYHTRAAILHSTPAGEANKRYWLFTRDLGLVVATAQGVRKSGAKLQGHLTEYAFVDVDLVKGRDVWRLTSAHIVSDPLADDRRAPQARAYVRMLQSIYRFLGEESEPHGALFDHVQECASVLVRSTTDSQAFDTIGIWRILAHLGYLAVPADERWVFDSSLSEALAKLTPAFTKRLIAEVNETITHTHL